MMQHAEARVRTRGFTLIEMMVVMFIVSVLFGVSIASFHRLSSGPAMDIAERQARGALARVRLAAREQSALAEVIFEPGEPSLIRTRMTRDAGSWHFDVNDKDRGLGGRNNVARISGAKMVDEGTVRACLEFGGGDSVKCGRLAAYEPMRGFDISMDIRPSPKGDGGGLASFGDLFSFELGEDGELMAVVTIEGEGDSVTVKTSKDVVEKDAWCRVRLTFDGIDIRLFAHQVLEAEKRIVKQQSPGPRRLASPETGDRLTFGSKTWGGLIDEVIYRTVEDEEVTMLAEGQPVFFDHKTPVRVRFDAEGRLDPRVHDAEVVVKLKDIEGATRSVRVDLTGLMR